MSQFKPYPAYKDSGVEWLGEVPEHWESWKVAHAFGELGSGTTPPTSEAQWYEDGTVPWVTTGELRENVIFETKKLLSYSALSAFSALRLHPAGSLAIAMYGATIGRLGILGVDAATNQACCLLTRPNHLDVKFTFYWLLVFKQNFIELYASGGGQPNINQEVIANLKIPAPGLLEQAQIARFLDHETARIDALIEEQQRLIELLKEKRQSVISHAVTKGLDPTVPMKDSGVEWLGEVPAHWRSHRVKRLFRQSKRQGYTDMEVLSVYRDYGVVRKSSRNDNNNKTPEDLSLYQLVNSGDLVVNKMKAWQGSLGVSEHQGITSPDYVVYSPIHDEAPKFIHYSLRANHMTGVYLSISNGIRPSQWRIEPEKFEQLEIFLPSKSEQLEIVSYLEAQTRKFNELILCCEQASEFFSERRSALISAAVTGKIDLRGWQPPASTPAPLREQETV